MSGTFNLGKDNRIDIFDPVSGAVMAWSILTSFEATPEVNIVKSVGIDGTNRFRTQSQSYSLAMSFDRASAAMDDWWTRYEADYYAGRIQSPIIITQTIQELDGSVSQYRFTGVSLSPTSLGTWKGDDKVEMQFKGMASRREKVG
jgi:hypothetical protein